MLAQAVRELRKTGVVDFQSLSLDSYKELPNLVTVDLPITIGIPLDYVPDQSMRLKLYRRLADLQSEEEIDAMQEEFKDRFGPLPGEVKNLLYYLTVKIRAEKAGLASVAQENDQIVLRFPVVPQEAQPRHLPILPYVRVGKNAYWMAVGNENEWQSKLLEILNAIHELRLT